MEVSMQQTADLAITTKPFSIQAKVRVTPAGLLSIAALASTILLSSAVIAWVAKQR